MAVVNMFPGGVTGGFAGPGRVGDSRPLRGDVCGWSPSASRRLLQWLMSVNSDALDRPDGWAVTLTVKDCPPTSAEWVAVRRAMLKRVDRLGAVMVHWVTEWTAKGVPHLHMAVYGPGMLDGHILAAWLSVVNARGWEVRARAQHIVPISAAGGWLEYVSKHAARGVHHYQRMGAPAGWSKTGRLWGYRGEWPVSEPATVDLELHEFHEFRRLLRTYHRKKLEGRGGGKYARFIGFNYRDKERGRMMGVSGWCPDTIAATFLELALNKVPSIRYDDWE